MRQARLDPVPSARAMLPRNDTAWSTLEARAQQLTVDESAWPAFVQALHVIALPRLRRNWLKLDPEERFELADDAALNVFVRLLERLKSRNYVTLKRFFESKQASASGAVDGVPVTASFRAYLKVIFARATIDYQRTDRRYRRATRADDRHHDSNRNGTWHSFVSAHSSAGAGRDPVTLWSVAQRMLEYLDSAHQLAQAHVNSSGRGDRQTYAALAEKLLLYRDDQPDWAAARALTERGKDFRRAIELEISGWSQDEIGAELAMSRRVTQRVLSVAKQLLRARFAREHEAI